MDDILYVSGEELKNNFDKYRMEALTKPVCVWEEGQDNPDVVLISGRDWRRMTRKREVISTAHMTPEELDRLANNKVPEEFAHITDGIEE